MAFTLPTPIAGCVATLWAAPSQIRLHIVQHLNRAVDEVRRSEMRRLSRTERTPFKRCRFLLLKNPWNLKPDEKDRLSQLVSLNAPIVRAYYLKEAFQLFWDYQQPGPSRAASSAVHALRHALSPGAIQGLRADASRTLARSPGLDQTPGIERRLGRNEQQNQTGQPPLLRLPQRRQLHGSDLSLLRTAPAARRKLITLLGKEPKKLNRC